MKADLRRAGFAEVPRRGKGSHAATIAWSEDDNLFLASVPDVPGIVTHGATPEEAARRGKEIIILWLTSMLDAGYDVPEPSVTARGVAD